MSELGPFFERSTFGHVDLPRAREGGFGGGFFACWAPPDPRASWTEESALTVTEDGYEVSLASDGEQAWALAQEHLPDLVILDVMMPGMSGWEVCRKIREDIALAHTASPWRRGRRGDYSVNWNSTRLVSVTRVVVFAWTVSGARLVPKANVVSGRNLQSR